MIVNPWNSNKLIFYIVHWGCSVDNKCSRRLGCWFRVRRMPKMHEKWKWSSRIMVTFEKIQNGHTIVTILNWYFSHNSVLLLYTTPYICYIHTTNDPLHLSTLFTIHMSNLYYVGKTCLLVLFMYTYCFSGCVFHCDISVCSVAHFILPWSDFRQRRRGNQILHHTCMV